MTIGGFSTFCSNYLQYIRSTTKVLVILERLRKREENNCLGAELASSIGSISNDLKLIKFYSFENVQYYTYHLILGKQ